MEIVGIDDVVEETAASLAAHGFKTTKALIKATLQHGFDTIERTAVPGTTVRIRGFGSFTLKDRAARQGRNPQTGEALQIAATTHLHFKQSKAAK